jgi:quercetin dioxygenase-like cupin family protein
MKWIFAIASLVMSATCLAAEGETKAPAVVATELMVKDFPAETGSQGRMLTVEFAPGAASKPHTHPGAIFAYVLEGSVVAGLNNDEAKTYKTGESWYEQPGCVHRVSRNASTTEKAKLLVFFVTQPGKKIVEPIKE